MAIMKIQNHNEPPLLEIKYELPQTWSTDSSMIGRLVMYTTKDPDDRHGKIGIIVANSLNSSRNIIISPNTGIYYGHEAIKHIWELARIPVTIEALTEILEKE